MGRQVKDYKLGSVDARRELPVRKEPYWREVGTGIHLGFYKGVMRSSWIARYREGGKYRYHDLGTPEALTYDQAHQQARELKGLPHGKQLRVAEAIEDHLQWSRQHRRDSYGTACRLLTHALPAFGQRTVASLTTAELQTWLNALATAPRRWRSAKGTPVKFRPPPKTANEKRARKATANRIWFAFRAALNRAFKSGKVEDDRAWRRVEQFRKITPPPPEYLRVDEVRRLLPACAPDLHKLALAALHTGARYGELARVEPRHVDLNRNQLYITSEAKSGRGRHIPLSVSARNVLVALLKDHPGGKLFLQADGKSWRKGSTAVSLRAAMEQAGLPSHYTFKIFRSTFASNFANLPGARIEVLSQILGHASVEITRKHYAVLFDRTLALSVQAMPSFEETADSQPIPLAA